VPPEAVPDTRIRLNQGLQKVMMGVSGRWVYNEGTTNRKPTAHDVDKRGVIHNIVHRGVT
jgi:hypothetical protein